MYKAQTIESFQSKTIDVVIPAYNVCDIIYKSVRSTLMQILPADWNKNIIIVDDGSTDGTAGYCKTMFKEKVKIISHAQNRGRSAGRNTGWHSGSGRYVSFLDADCEWHDTNSLAAHVEKLETVADVCTGAITARNQGFWGSYQNMIQSSREKDFASGNLAAFTSANFVIKRSILDTTGGFDEGYRHYGFEDRDFLLRLISLGVKVVFCPEATAIHTPDLSLRDVCRKMTESGQNSSYRFQTAHPEYYAQSLYGKIDCRLHGQSLTALAMFSEPFVSGLAGLGDKIIGLPGIPFNIKRAWVKMMSGLAYLVGTYRGASGK